MNTEKNDADIFAQLSRFDSPAVSYTPTPADTVRMQSDATRGFGLSGFNREIDDLIHFDDLWESCVQTPSEKPPIAPKLSISDSTISDNIAENTPDFADKDINTVSGTDTSISAALPIPLTADFLDGLNAAESPLGVPDSLNATDKVCLLDTLIPGSLVSSALDFGNSPVGESAKSESLNKLENLRNPEKLDKTEAKLKSEALSDNRTDNRAEKSASSAVVSEESVQSLTDNSIENREHVSRFSPSFRLSLIVCLTAIFIGLFFFSQEILPAYLIRSHIYQTTGLSIEMKNVKQNFSQGITQIDSVVSYDSAQQPYFQTGKVSLSSLPYLIGKNQHLNWAVIENIRFISPLQSGVSIDQKNYIESKPNSFAALLQSNGRVLTNSEMDSMVETTVADIQKNYQNRLTNAVKEAETVGSEAAVLQGQLAIMSDLERRQASENAAKTAQELSARLNNAVAEVQNAQTEFQSRKNTLLTSIQKQPNTDSQSVQLNTAIADGSVSDCLFAQSGIEFVEQFLQDIQQITRWLPDDMQSALGVDSSLDSMSMAMRQVEVKDQITIGQLRLTGETRFMNQTQPYTAVITNYSSLPNDKPMTMDIAFGTQNPSRLRIEAVRDKKDTQLKVEFYRPSGELIAHLGSESAMSLTKQSAKANQNEIRTDMIELKICGQHVEGQYRLAQANTDWKLALSNASSAENQQKLDQIASQFDKLYATVAFEGKFNQPNYKITSNLEPIGKSLIKIAADESSQRMEQYRLKLAAKYEKVFAHIEQQGQEIQQRIAKTTISNRSELEELSSDKTQLANKTNPDSAPTPFPPASVEPVSAPASAPIASQATETLELQDLPQQSSEQPSEQPTQQPSLPQQSDNNSVQTPPELPALPQLDSPDEISVPEPFGPDMNNNNNSTADKNTDNKSTEEQIYSNVTPDQAQEMEFPDLPQDNNSETTSVTPENIQQENNQPENNQSDNSLSDDLLPALPQF